MVSSGNGEATDASPTRPGSITVVRIVYCGASQFLPMDFELPKKIIIRENYYTLTAI